MKIKEPLEVSNELKGEIIEFLYDVNVYEVDLIDVLKICHYHLCVYDSHLLYCRLKVSKQVEMMLRDLLIWKNNIYS